jgi:excisionase family DNA binding protein
MSKMSTGRTSAEKGHGRLLSPKAACERLDCSAPTLYALIHAGELKSFKIGKYRKIVESSIDTLIERNLAAQNAA